MSRRPFSITTAGKTSVYGLRRGFDPQFKHLWPGLVLQKMMLEDGHRRGDRCYDLGAGSHDTKQPWRTTVQASYRFTFFPALVLRRNCCGGIAGSATGCAASRILPAFPLSPSLVIR